MTFFQSKLYDDLCQIENCLCSEKNSNSWKSEVAIMPDSPQSMPDSLQSMPDSLQSMPDSLQSMPDSQALQDAIWHTQKLSGIHKSYLE